MKDCYILMDGEVIVIDGEILCGFYDCLKGKGIIYMVNVFVIVNGMSIG